MFARSSTILAQATMIDAGMEYMRDTVMPAMTHVEGFVGLSVMLNRETGTCIATSAWRTEQAMRDSAPHVAAIRGAAAEALGGTVDVEEWEVAVMHRAHHARPGTCMRGTWTTVDPARIDAAMDVFKFTTLAQIEDLPGFCGASLLINRVAGRAVVTVAYDDQAALDRSREPGSAVRDTTARQAGLDVINVAEFDLELAHLHVPEML